MNIKDINQSLLDIYNRHSKKQGKSNILPNNTPYDWVYEVSKDLNFKWTGHRSIKKIYELITNDTKDFLFTRGLMVYNWNLYSTYTFYKNIFHLVDINNIVFPNVINGKVTDLKKIIELLHKNYIIKSTVIYLIGVKDDEDNVLPPKKVGFSNQFDDRLYNIEKAGPLYPFVIKKWFVPFSERHKIEASIHKQLKSHLLRDKKEWFKDPDNSIESLIDNFINN